MRVDKDNKKRLCLFISDVMDKRLEEDSVRYGTSKSDIVRVALVNYYRGVDGGLNDSASIVRQVASSGQA